MATRSIDIQIVKASSSPETETIARRKAEFDSSMVMVRHHVKFATTHDDGEYYFRELVREINVLRRRFGLKVG